MPPASPENAVEKRILLIGDAGQPSTDYREPVLDALEKQADKLPAKTLVMFLGDNIYPYGLDDTTSVYRPVSESRLKEQIKVVTNSKTSGIFIPGNHDWDKGKKNGWHKIVAEEQFINNGGYANVQFLPKGGCPGPVVLDISNNCRLIILDTQWWLHDNDKPDSSNSSCEYTTQDAVINALDNALKTAGNKFVIITAHHPLDTHGPHGGFFDWKSHIFPLRELNPYLFIPLPLIGSLYPLSRQMGITSQDISSKAYGNMKNRIESVIAKYKNVVYAAGHDHSLQVLKGVNNIFYLISGFGTSVNHTDVTAADNTVFADDEQGFMQVDVLKDGRSRLGVFRVDEDKKSWVEVFSLWLN